MKIDILTKPYEVTDQSGVRNEYMYMSKVKVFDPDVEKPYETILGYHLGSKIYVLLKKIDDYNELSKSFKFTENNDPELIKEFLSINHRTDIKKGRGTKYWLHITF